MSSLNEITLLAFRDELRKEAGFADFIAKNKGTLQGVGGLAGVGALGGGALGGLPSGVKGYLDARNEGSGIGGGVLHGLASGFGGAVRGAIKGTVGGALVGGAAGAAGQSFRGLVSSSGPLGGAARFGQRQVHSVTGMLTPQELEGIRGGAYAAKGHLANLAARGKVTDRARLGAEWANKAQDMNLTSIPGYLGAVKEHGLGKTLATSAKEQYYNMPTAMGALMVGAPVLSAAHALATPEDSNGPGKGEHVGREVGNALGGVMGGTMPLVGNALVGGAAGSAGAAAGRVIDRIRGRRPAVDDLGNKAPLEPTESQNTPTERVMSPSAAGQQKDVGL